MKEVKLPSGAVLKITLSPFAISKALYQSILKEAKTISFDSKTELSILYKELFCVGFSSPLIEACLSECLKRCTYNDLRIDEATFEPVEARNDYMMVCMEVAKENVLPFISSLYVEFQRVLQEMTESSPK